MNFFKIFRNLLISKLLPFFLLLCVSKSIRAQNELRLEAGGSGDVSDLRWSIAGNLNGQSPNILSELHFKRITSAGVFLNGTYQPKSYLEFHINYKKNWILGGSGTDTDYQGDNRTNESYNEDFLSNEGYVINFESGLNWNLIKRRNVALRVGVFYLADSQNLYILNSSFEGLNSTYTASWKGAKMGIGATFDLNRRFQLILDSRLYLIRYNSKANWNLIEEFMHPVSFTQKSTGNGVDGAIGLNYKISRLFDFKLNGQYFKIAAKKGVDESFLQNGNHIYTQFNGISFNSLTVQLGVVIKFL